MMYFCLNKDGNIQMSLWSFYKVEYHFKASSIADMEGAVSLRIWHVRLGYLFGFVVVLLHCGYNSLREVEMLPLLLPGGD